jgi:hypothetical protein
VKLTRTAIVDLDQFNAAYQALQRMEGNVSWAKVNPILLAFQGSIIPPPDDKDDEEKCPSPTPQKSSSRKSETSTS